MVSVVTVLRMVGHGGGIWQLFDRVASIGGGSDVDQCICVCTTFTLFHYIVLY